MQYKSISMIKELLDEDEMLRYGRSLWYGFAEGYFSLPETYQEYKFYKQQLNSFELIGWKTEIEFDGTIILFNKISHYYGTFMIQIDRSGKETIRLLPI